MSSETSYAQRIVVVTGAGSGIGRATAAMFAEMGEIVYGLDLNPTVPEGVTYVECNVGDRATVDAAIERCAEHGRIDVLANVAGVVQFGHFAAITDEEWDRVQAINLKGPFMLIQAALPYLKACQGNIVNISSVAGRIPQPYATAYAASKGGLNTLTQALALELSPDGIRVNAICPGTVDTPIITEVSAKMPDDLDPKVAGRLLMMLPGTISPTEVAASVRYLSSPEARFVTGVLLAIDGAMG